MINHVDDQIIQEENAVFSLAAMSVLGDREDQQDTFGFSLRPREGLAVVCDGMGGYEGGKAASEAGVGTMLEDYASRPDSNADTMCGAARSASEAIGRLTDRGGSPIRAGSTMAAVLIRDRSLQWCSVGDSRAYLQRGDELVQLTQDQNYLTVLRERLRAGLIDEQTFSAELPRGEGLISYLGIGKLELIDYSAQPFPLQAEDRVILMSDGLYKVVPDEELGRVISNFSNIGEAVGALELKARKNAKNSNINRDNMTVMIIKIK